jgi:hypothetical protein
MKRLILCLLASLIPESTVWPSTGAEQQALIVQTLAERRVTGLPSGERLWKIDRYSSRKDAQAAAEPWSLVGPEVAMQVASSGATDLQALVMFVVDANKPFSSPASFPGG